MFLCTFTTPNVPSETSKIVRSTDVRWRPPPHWRKKPHIVTHTHTHTHTYAHPRIHTHTHTHTLKVWSGHSSYDHAVLLQDQSPEGALFSSFVFMRARVGLVYGILILYFPAEWVLFFAYLYHQILKAISSLHIEIGFGITCRAFILLFFFCSRGWGIQVFGGAIGTTELQIHYIKSNLYTCACTLKSLSFCSKKRTHDTRTFYRSSSLVDSPGFVWGFSLPIIITMRLYTGCVVVFFNGQEVGTRSSLGKVVGSLVKHPNIRFPSRSCPGSYFRPTSRACVCLCVYACVCLSE